MFKIKDPKNSEMSVDFPIHCNILFGVQNPWRKAAMKMLLKSVQDLFLVFVSL